ncbi:MAG: hypothetical protein HYY18_14865 [Planctomycetes bacterium]|nr:hypothetical protein [Planctomycetota bacterium]
MLHRLPAVLALAVAFVALSAAPARAEEEQVAIPEFPPRPKEAPDASPDGIARELAALGADDAGARRAAGERLFWIGEPARPGLEAALKSEDPEVGLQARRVLALLDARKALTPVNVKFKVRGYVVVGSKVEDEKALGGFYKAPNAPVPVPEGLKALPEMVSFVVERDALVVFGRRHLGLRVRLVNMTDKDLPVEASDSRIPVFMQARNEKGEWIAIEYLPSSW